jgi:hypothetical protein
MSASPAKAFAVQKSTASNSAERKNILFLPIRNAQLAQAQHRFPAFFVKNVSFLEFSL